MPKTPKRKVLFRRPIVSFLHCFSATPAPLTLQMVSFYRYCYDTCEYALKIQKKQKPFSLWGPQAAIYRRGFKISNSVNEPCLMKHHRYPQIAKQQNSKAVRWRMIPQYGSRCPAAAGGMGCDVGRRGVTWRACGGRGCGRGAQPARPASAHADTCTGGRTGWHRPWWSGETPQGSPQLPR